VKIVATAIIGMATISSLAAGCAHQPKSDVQDPVALAEEGQADLAANKPAEALTAFDAALVRDPHSLAALRGRIEASRRLGHLPEVGNAATAQTASAPEDGYAWYVLGLCRFASGDERGSVQALLRATELLPREADAHYRLGLALFNGEKFAEAKGPLAKSVELNPRSARYRVPLASDLDRLGDHRGAVAVLAPIPELAPTAEEARLAVATSRALSEPFRGIPQESRAQLELALGYLLRDAPGLAIGPLEELIAKLPDLGAAHALLGLAAARLDEAGRAVTELKRAAELSPDAPQPHAYLAELYAGHGRPDQALAEYQLALARDPLDTATLRKLGMMEIDQPAGAAPAIATFRKLAALLPDDDPAQLLLARAELFVPELVPEGRALLEKLAKRRPQDPEVLLRLALVLLDVRAGETGSERESTTRRAVELTHQVLSLQPDNAAAARLLTALQTG
jgi:tetratricopeptide (TPR) repeat protein